MRSYAGIGSRKTPTDILAVMTELAMWLEGLRWLLRSGGAQGADIAFEAGALGIATRRRPRKRIFKAKDCTRGAIEHASLHHPAWDRCSHYAKALHGRNSMIMLGRNLDDPVDMVICWTPDGLTTGGTGQALRIAQSMNIPVFNFGHGSHIEQTIHICQFVKGLDNDN